MSLAFFISLFNAQRVSDVNTSILRSLRLICWVISWLVLLWYEACWCYVVVWLRLCGIRMQAEAQLQPAWLIWNYVMRYFGSTLTEHRDVFHCEGSSVMWEIDRRLQKYETLRNVWMVFVLRYAGNKLHLYRSIKNRGERIPVGVRFSAPVQTGPADHPASYSMGTESFLGVNAAGAWRWTPTRIWRRG